MKVFFKILIIGMLSQILIFLILTLFSFKMWKSFEQAEVVIGILGLATTFLGAYFGAKIAGSESRKLFKQEIKMNDLSKNMEKNLDVLEQIEYINRKIDFINKLIRGGEYLEPDGLRQLQRSSNETNQTLSKVKAEYLSQTSIILYSDIQNLYENFNKFNNKIKGIINYDETRRLIKSVEKNDIPMESINLWEHYSVYTEKSIVLLFINDKGKEITEQIQIDFIIKKNKSFFDDKKAKVEEIFDNVNQSFNTMKYKKRDDLIKEYTELYKI